MKKKKCVIIYSSYHHMNTKKIVDEIHKRFKIRTVPIKDIKKIDLDFYEYIGFASGIYYGTFDKRLLKLADDYSFNENQNVFLIYTCGVEYKNHAKGMEDILKKKKCEYLDKFKCSGFDTYGILKFIGGVNRNHPNKFDLVDAIDFMKNILDEK